MFKPRDHTKLICDISELNSLFEDAPSLEAFLQKIVEMIADHMHSEVCSIYLYYQENEELVLTATYGLHQDSIGKVRMKLGEGLTGLTLSESRPICESSARTNPNFKYFPGIGEERFESFLAVPIIRGQTRIGVMVTQNLKKNYFSVEDISVCRAITSQLANTIETTKLLMTVREVQRKKPESSKPQDLKFIKGRVGSEGFAFCEAVVLDFENFRRLVEIQNFDARYTLEDFQRAVRLTEKQLEEYQAQIEKQLADVASLIFMAQILMLKDKGFVDAMADLIKEGINPPEAVLKIVKEYVLKFDAMSDSYLREKRHDVEDIGKRLLENLVGAGNDCDDCQGRIVIARELFPSNILKLSSQGVKGIILLSGGVSSHLSILARSLNIPLIITDNAHLLDIRQRTQILLDAEQGNIYVEPSADIILNFKERDEARARLGELKESFPEETHTLDKTRIKLLSNINLLSGLKTARELKSEGIGLYRTEFPFIVRSDFPSEEEQLVIYKKLIEGMPHKEITFRTLDIGGDKVLSYYNHEKEENPFLGMRSIRFSLRHKEIFAAQIRAILRAGHDADIKIMFPMISSLDEFLEAKAIVHECRDALNKERIPYNAAVPIGIMVELPSVLEIIEDLTAEADFLCIGTNDFIQYMLAVDRTNEKVADMYLAHHPAVLRSLKKIVDAGKKFKKDVTICGDMAHETKYLPYLLGIGIRRISLDTRYLPKIKLAITKTDLPQAEKLTKELLTYNRLSHITRIVEQGL